MSWRSAVHRSRIGASHRRKGLLCQDYSLTSQFFSRNGVPIKLLAVADGHGGSRYWRSHVGSRLACEMAIQQARQGLEKGVLECSVPTSSILPEWHQWLHHDLPEKILSEWRIAVANDWQFSKKSGDFETASFSLDFYGSTLGLVVLTPHWWGCTGLGDWDLVCAKSKENQGFINAELVNQENILGKQGESTFSLCRDDAMKHFGERCSVHGIESNETPFALVLSTDGIRKACAADRDFLTLSSYLANEGSLVVGDGECKALDQDLDRITSEGSGDDVSVAIGIYGELNQKSRSDGK